MTDRGDTGGRRHERPPTSGHRERTLHDRTRALPREVQPRRDLWPAVASGIARAGEDRGDVREASPGGRPSPLREPGRWRRLTTPALGGWLAAAATVAVILLARTAAGPQAPTNPVVPSLEADCSEAQDLRSQLHAAPRTGRETRDVVDENLRIVEAAIAEARRALSSHPDDPHLTRHLTGDLYPDRIALLGLSARLTTDWNDTTPRSGAASRDGKEQT